MARPLIDASSVERASMNQLNTLLITAVVTAIAAPAFAGDREPLVPRTMRVSEIDMIPGVAEKVERVRSPGRTAVRFEAEPSEIQAGAVVLFQIHTRTRDGDVLRWRCIAIDDVS